MVEILKKTKLSDNIYEIVIDAPNVSLNVLPGQFFMLQATEKSEVAFPSGLNIYPSELLKECAIIAGIIELCFIVICARNIPIINPSTI